MEAETSRAPAVSVIIPARNYARFIGQAIRSIEEQSFQDVEIIVVDDGSIDDLAGALTKAECRLPLQLISQPPRGISAARNVGLAAARGRYVAFIDADDYWPDRDQLQTQFVFLENRRDIGWIFGDAAAFDENGPIDTPYLQAFGLYKPDDQGKAEPFHLTPSLLATRGFFIPTGTVMLRRTCLEEVGKFDENLAMFEDFDLWLRLHLRYPIAFIPKVLLMRRIHSGNTGERRFLYIDDLLKLFKKHINLMGDVSFDRLAARAHAEAALYHLCEHRSSKARAAAVKSLRHQRSLRTMLILMLASMGSTPYLAMRTARQHLRSMKTRLPFRKVCTQ